MRSSIPTDLLIHEGLDVLKPEANPVAAAVTAVAAARPSEYHSIVMYQALAIAIVRC